MLNILHGCIVDIDFDILPIVAESLAKDSKTANMFGIVVHRHTESEIAAVVQVKAVDGHIGDFQAIYEGAFFIDHQQF